MCIHVHVCQSGEREKEIFNWEWRIDMDFWNIKRKHLPQHSPYLLIPLKPSQIISPTAYQTFKYMILWESFFIQTITVINLNLSPFTDL